MRSSVLRTVAVVLLAGTGACAVTAPERAHTPAAPLPPIRVGALPPSATTGPPPTPPTTVAQLPASTLAASTTTAAPRPLRLLFTGDVLMHSPLWAQALLNGGGTTRDFTPMFADLRPGIEAADLAVCHLETPIAPPGEPYSSSPRYGVPAEVVDALAAVGFDHCSTASNHTFDRGVPGVVATADRFELGGMTQHGMARTPAERDPVLVDVAGLTIGLLSATYGFDVGAPPADEPWRSARIDAAQLIADATLARARGADLVVASLHWGDSNSHRASTFQRRIATTLADSGTIDLIVGHHAHVVQPIERIGTTWVAYGLGNAISNLPVSTGIWSQATRDGIVLEVTVTRYADGTAGLASLAARPIWVDHDAGWVVRDVTSALADPELVGRIGSQLEASLARTTSVVGPFVPPAAATESAPT